MKVHTSLSKKPAFETDWPHFGHPSLQGIRIWYPVLPRYGTELRDIVNKNNMSAVGGAYINEQAADPLSGATDYFEVTHRQSQVLTGAHSVSALIYSRSATSYAGIIIKGTSIDGQLQWGFSLHSRRFWTKFGSSAGVVAGTEFIPLNQWIYVGYAWDTENVYVYIDGRAEASSPYAKVDTLPSVTHPVRIGLWANDTLPFNGQVADVRVYDRFLDAKDFKDIHTNPWAPFKVRRPFVAAAAPVTIPAIMNHLKNQRIAL